MRIFVEMLIEFQKRDQAEFLQIWGRPAKIHLDPTIAAAAESTL